MLLRAYISVAVVVLLQLLVVSQIRSAGEYLTVEQLAAENRSQALSFDRHYAMPLDFCIIAPFTGLILFLCSAQWSGRNIAVAALASIVIIGGCLLLWKNGNEAHAHDGRVTTAGWLHAVFAAVVVWAIIMALHYTPRPEPVLLLVMGIVVPAFLFVGQHMFLGLINYQGDASTFPDAPLRNPIAWGVLASATLFVWWRAYVLIPASFWSGV